MQSSTDIYSEGFNIISFNADKRHYYPASMKRESWMDENYLTHEEIIIEPGQSRYGGPIIDLPPDFSHPKGLRFAAQLDLAKFSPFDKTGLLPKTGQLILFFDLVNDIGKAFYTDFPNEKLVRHVVEHDEHFFEGILINGIFADVEKWEERFRQSEDEWDRDHANKDGKVWDDFAGSERSKIFGIFTHCQFGQQEIEEITFSDKILLLQIGQNGFNDEGVFSVLIPEKDLKARIFENCEFHWGQS